MPEEIINRMLWTPPVLLRLSIPSAVDAVCTLGSVPTGPVCHDGSYARGCQGGYLHRPVQMGAQIELANITTGGRRTDSPLGLIMLAYGGFIISHTL